MKKSYFKTAVRLLSLALLAALFIPAAGFSNPASGNHLIFQSKPTQSVVNITMIASVPQFKNGKLTGGWDPRRIIVYQGQTVNLTIEALDVQHIFALPAYGIKQPLTPGKKEQVSFVANKTGMFFFQCDNKECAPMALHRLMVGQLIVKDEKDTR